MSFNFVSILKRKVLQRNKPENHRAPTEKELIFNDLWGWFKAHAALEPNKILEIGVGPDGFSRFYAEKCNSYVGIDVDEYSQFYKDCKNVKIIKYDGEHFPIDDASIDLCVSHSVFEHVTNLPAMFNEMWRVLRPNGLSFISINPLYYSSWGHHGFCEDHQTKLPDWEHLNPASPYYLTDCPPHMEVNGQKGCFLNKATMSEILAEVGKNPWSIMTLIRDYEHQELPGFLQDSSVSETDLRNHDFRMIIKKDDMTSGIWPFQLS